MKTYFAGRYYAVSSLATQYREALERLVFFNDEQWRLRTAMLHAIEHHGNPRISIQQNQLVLELDRDPAVQSLFVLKDEGDASRLSGVVVFTRAESLLRVIYVGLEPTDAYGSGDEAYLFVALFELLKGVGRRIRGIQFVEFNQGRRKFRLSVQPQS